MPNGIKYTTGATPTGCLRKGNMLIANNTADYGSTFYSGVNPPAGGYTIYLNKASGGPSIYCPANDSQLISITNQIAGASYTTAAQCLSYFAGQSDKLCVNFNYESIVTDGLVLNLDAGFAGSYPTTGTTWYDLSGNTNNGTLVNGPTYSSDGGGSIDFDGSNDLVNGPINVTWFSNSSFTIESWFKFDSSPPTEQLWFSANQSPPGATQQDIHLRVSRGNGLRFGFYSNDLDASGVVSHSNWYQVVCWYDYSNDNSKIYVNGSEVVSGNQGPYTPANAQIGIGYWINRNQQYFKGNIAITRIYNRAITSDEVLQNYNATKGRFGL